MTNSTIQIKNEKCTLALPDDMYILMPKIYNFGRFPNHIWSPCLKGYYLDKPGLCVQVVFALFVGYFDNV
jgi:hypothetical protein